MEFKARFRAVSWETLLPLELRGGVVARGCGFVEDVVSVKGARLPSLSRGEELSLWIAMSRCFLALTRSCRLCRVESPELFSGDVALDFIVSSITPIVGEFF